MEDANIKSNKEFTYLSILPEETECFKEHITEVINATIKQVLCIWEQKVQR